MYLPFPLKSVYSMQLWFLLCRCSMVFHFINRLFIHSPINGHLNYLQLENIKNCQVVNILLNVFFLDT